MARSFTSIVAEALGLSPDFDATVYQTQAGIWLNDALKKLARSGRIPLEDTTATVTATVATPTTALPATFVRILDLFDPTTGDALEETTQEWIDDQGPVNGIPTAYALFGNNVVWYPTPSGTRNFTMHFIAAPADIAGATGITGVIPDEYGDALTSFIRWHLFRAEDDFEMALAWKAEWIEQKRELIADVAMRGRRVRRTPSMFTGQGAPTFRSP